ncbi:hypothetical protein MCOR25_010365 [Pyricularia grisea]|uniref:Delta(24)-sterol reductase n=1 Tax=Pyricularia grisea TaxID=148305 RepID=A0A6P8BG28_PYRGI|nr:uncharacterized protein PgNI_01364 [Pyricularia grisea]KAI6350823.1 hypothetical protein MCOR25_010365 [Pyricularia grisea]TLD15584.1 hypothetical protein PgNI_01364 [Pyricularia grisea]
MEAHNAAVATISARVKHFSEARQPFRIYHGSTNSTRRSDKRADNTVDTSGLDHVLSIDPERRVAVVEPNVPMDALVAATTAHGLVPPVVMEFPGITAGGGFSGTSGESSSFRHGAFDATVEWVEVVLPTGEVARASRSGEWSDLFWGAASAFGTLGVVTLMELRLVQAKPYVQLEYHFSKSVGDAVDKMREEMAREENDYIDGIVYSLGEVVTCVGRLVDTVPEGGRIQQFTRRKDPWFYVHVEKNILPRLKGRGQKQIDGKPEDGKQDSTRIITEYVPLTDYLFRYDRGGFWAARWAFRYFLTPFNRGTRYVLDPLLHTRVMYRALHKSGLADFCMTQDVGVPFDKAVEFANWLDGELTIYPLWLCPLRLRRAEGPDSAHGLHSQFADPDAPDLLNFGVWGDLPKGNMDRRAAVRSNRRLEAKVAELQGKKWLYAQAFYTEEEFWAHYDRASYDALRKKYGADYLPSVYDKVRVDVDAEEAADAGGSFGTRAKKALWKVWPVRGLYGVLAAIKSDDYLMQKTRRQKKGGAKATS